MASEELSLQIFFGSQTGCAHEVADYIEYDAHRRGMTSVVRSLEGVTPQDVAACPGFVVFVVSTCGEGEVPDNMKVFWRMLRNRNLPNNLLKEKKVGVFGLGDSGYSKFNYSAKLLYRRLELLGAVFMTGRGDGDDRHPLGLEACLDPWLNDLWTFIEKASGRSYVVSHLGAAPKARVEVTVSSMRGVLNTKPPTCTTIEKADSTTLPYSLLNPCTSALVSNRRITAPEWEQDVRHCVLNVSGKSISHAPGDVVCILPVNSEDKVKHFLNHVGLDGDLVLTSLTSKDGRWDHVPLPISMFDFCLRYLDFDGCPRGRTFFLMLSYFTTSEIEKEKLDFFATAEGQSALRLYSLKEKRSYTEILEDFRHVHLPLNYLFSIIPPLKARSFSIASSLTLHPEELHVCVAVVEFLTPLKRKRYGLCSNWLASVTLQEEENNHRQDGGNAKETTGMPLSLRPSFPVRIWIEKGSIRYPSEDACDIIMVGPGTGCAPFRSFIEERATRRRKGAKIGKTIFFFGCRHKDTDYHYGKEMEAYQSEGVLDLYSVAFSRDTEQKIYVQDKIRQHALDVWQIIKEKNFYVYVSGSSLKMPQAVREAFKDIISQRGNVTIDQAEKYISTLEAKGRYNTETWS